MPSAFPEVKAAAPLEAWFVLGTSLLVLNDKRHWDREWIFNLHAESLRSKNRHSIENQNQALAITAFPAGTGAEEVAPVVVLRPPGPRGDMHFLFAASVPDLFGFCFKAIEGLGEHENHEAHVHLGRLMLSFSL